jgi:hypothetical protein
LGYSTVKKLSERFNQAIEAIDKQKKAGEIIDIGTLFWQTL